MHTVERGYLQLLDFTVDMLPVLDAPIDTLLQSMAELLNASNLSDQARTIRIPSDLRDGYPAIYLNLGEGKPVLRTNPVNDGKEG